MKTNESSKLTLLLKLDYWIRKRKISQVNILEYFLAYFLLANNVMIHYFSWRYVYPKINDWNTTII